MEYKSIEYAIMVANTVVQVANLYYSHPILDILAQFFDVSHERASLIPTCSQAGYATGLIFLCPLGDLVRRRHFVLLLTLVTAALWIGVCITKSFEVFLVLSYLSSITTVTPVSGSKQACSMLWHKHKSYYIYSKLCSLSSEISSPQLVVQQPYQSCPRDSSWVFSSLACSRV